MNIAALAKNVYSDAQAPIQTFRSTEYQVFARVTHRLSSVSLDDFDDYLELVSALHDNRKLWRILASDVAEEGNELPQELRAKIFYLAEFTEHHSKKVLAKEASPAALVEINTAIMRGLRASAGGGS